MALFLIRILGLIDLGSVNHEIDYFAYWPGISPQLADHMLSFTIRPVYKPSRSYMIASYASLDLCGHNSYAIVWEVIEALEVNGIPILSITCDRISTNKKSFKICRSSKEHLTHKTFKRDHIIYFFCDPPNLLKTVQKYFANLHAYSDSRQ